MRVISRLVSGEVSCGRGIVSVGIVTRYWLLCLLEVGGQKERGRGTVTVSVLSVCISFVDDGSGICGIVSSHSAKNGFLRLGPSFTFLALASFVFFRAFEMAAGLYG